MNQRYHSVAIFLHWLIALAIFGMIALGFIMGDESIPAAERYPLYQWHKSIGITILLLSFFRLYWRMTHTPPPLPDSMPTWEKAAAHLGHWALYALMIGLPLTGWMMVSASPKGIPTVLYGLIPWPHLPVLSTLDPEQKQSVAHWFKETHEWLAYLMLATAGGHACAALRHHFFLKDTVLVRMLPRWRKS